MSFTDFLAAPLFPDWEAAGGNVDVFADSDAPAVARLAPPEAGSAPAELALDLVSLLQPPQPQPPQPQPQPQSQPPQPQSQPPQPQSQPPLPPRRYAQTARSGACQHCRAKKLRCDGQSPCARCVRKGIVCLHGPASASRSGGGAMTGKTEMSQIAALQQEIATLRMALAAGAAAAMPGASLGAPPLVALAPVATLSAAQVAERFRLYFNRSTVTIDDAWFDSTGGQAAIKAIESEANRPEIEAAPAAALVWDDDVILLHSILATQYWLDGDTEQAEHHATRARVLVRLRGEENPTRLLLAAHMGLIFMAYVSEQAERMADLRRGALRAATALGLPPFEHLMTAATGVRCMSIAVQVACVDIAREPAPNEIIDAVSPPGAPIKTVTCRLPSGEEATQVIELYQDHVAQAWQSPPNLNDASATTDFVADLQGLASAITFVAANETITLTMPRVNHLLNLIDTARNWVEERTLGGPMCDLYRSMLMGAAGLLQARYTSKGSMDRAMAEERMRLAVEAVTGLEMTRYLPPPAAGMFVAIAAYWVDVGRLAEWQTARQLLRRIGRWPTVREGVMALEMVVAGAGGCVQVA